MNRRLLFLPGAGAESDFWKPLGDLLPDIWEKTYFAWPGLGNQKSDPNVNCLDDLVSMVEESLTEEPVDILAQSMGGHIAVRVLLKHPEKIRRVVFTATGAGLNLTGFGGVDWKPDYQTEFPNAKIQILDENRDFTNDLPEIAQPVLILCGDADPICPVKAGKHLLRLLPNAKLEIAHGGDHAFVYDTPYEIVEFILRHLE